MFIMHDWWEKEKTKEDDIVNLITINSSITIII